MSFSKRLILAVLILPITAAVPLLTMAQDGSARSIQLSSDAGLMPSHERFPEVMRFSTAAPEFTSPQQNQVRIEQRVIVRIAPMAEQVRRQIREQQQSDEALVLAERPLADCVPLNSITGVGSANDNRLVFLMRDRRLVSARLGRTCSARDFYSGFYVDRHADGQLCVKRDELHAAAHWRRRARLPVMLVRGTENTAWPLRTGPYPEPAIYEICRSRPV